MQNLLPYPECLRRPDAGGHLQTRTTATEERYRTRYDSRARTYCRAHLQDVVTPTELANDLLHRASKLQPNSVKQYAASIRQHLRDLWDDRAISGDQVERIDVVLRHASAEAIRPKVRKRNPNTSAGRAKSITPEALSVLVKELLSRCTPIRQITAAMLEHSANLATRPSEFLAIEETVAGTFQVRSAKYSATNHRGLEPFRILPTDDYSSFELEELRNIASSIADERAAGATIESILRRCQRAIREARKALKGKKVTAYTSRHQARANMVALGMTPEEVAVVMGHASAGTAQTHYAPRRRAWVGMADAKAPAINPELVGKVRPANLSRIWINKSHPSFTVR